MDELAVNYKHVILCLGCAEHKGDTDCVKRCTKVEVEGVGWWLKKRATDSLVGIRNGIQPHTNFACDAVITVTTV